MLSLDQLRKIDPKFSGASDRQLEPLRQALYAMAQLAYEARHSKSGSKIPVGLFPPIEPGSTLELWNKELKQE